MILILAASLNAGKDERVLPYSALISSAKIYLGQKTKDYESATQRLQEAIDNYPDPLEAYYFMGLIHSERAEYREMLDKFDKVREICARAEAEENKKIKKRCKKEKMLEQIDDIILAEWEKTFQSGVTYLKMADSLSGEIKTASDDSLKAKLERITGDLLHKAKEEFEVSLLLDSTKFEAWTNIGMVEGHLENLEAAVEHYQRSHQLNPDDIGMLPDLANALYKLERFADAVLVYNEMADKDTANAIWALTYSAICYQKLKRQDELKQTYDRILEIDPNDAQIRYQRGMYYVQQASSEEVRDSLSHLDQLIKANPKNKSLKKAKEDLIDYRVNFYKMALPDFKIAAEQDSTDAFYQYWYGTSAFLANEVELARNIYERCVAINPDSKDCWCGLESVYARLQLKEKYEEAHAKCEGE